MWFKFWKLMLITYNISISVSVFSPNGNPIKKTLKNSSNIYKLRWEILKDFSKTRRKWKWPIKKILKSVRDIFLWINYFWIFFCDFFQRFLWVIYPSWIWNYVKIQRFIDIARNILRYEHVMMVCPQTSSHTGNE